MTDHVSSALYVYTKETEPLIKRLQSNSFGATITPVAIDDLVQNPQERLVGTSHVVVSGTLDVIKQLLKLAVEYGFSVGIVPGETQKDLIKSYRLPRNFNGALDLALRRDAQVMDLILCNEKILLFKATMGRVPLIDAPGDVSRMALLVPALKKFFGLKLLSFDFTTAGGQKIKTAASGCMILQRHVGSLASRLISHDSSFTDGMVSLVIAAPRSVVDYLKFLAWTLFNRSQEHKRLPGALGYIKSPRIHITSETDHDVFIDGVRATHTPLTCRTLPGAVRINIGPDFKEENKRVRPAGEKNDIDHLPRGKELLKTRKKQKIPFFSYASEARFRDLFATLREDARINMSYMVLMVLSTMLATVGLYLNSASVVIGAMLLAPLMAPIVSLAMGLLRTDVNLSKNSAIKIMGGILIALGAAAMITLLFPHKPITQEMQARLNPTLLDLAVAITAGVAGAYTKSFKEILQSLAGVAIAVALVPPLAVAGIGIGRWDLNFFNQAFLLFSTNLVGIILASAFTFRMLGYSAAVRGKRGIGVVALFLALISIPLYLSYDRIVEKRVVESGWKNERFLVNGKYLIIQKARLSRRGDKEVIFVDILARDQLTRADLTQFKQKIQSNFTRKLIIRAKVIYIP
ncbi:MAG: DUF389 domain-containing protein [Deltaproteobacteria bacterium]|jgi:uncharacterized hydrophobic protein (TIGR00271 family)|nr:DUF389 domain-containing protein [Deltaproteobacteria bacterium]